MKRSYIGWLVRILVVGTSALAGVVLSLACTRTAGATKAAAAAISADETDAATPACKTSSAGSDEGSRSTRL